MNNFYHKVAVAFVCTALGFALGVNEEAKAVSFTFSPTITFEVIDIGGQEGHTYNGLGDLLFPGNFGIAYSQTKYIEGGHETASFAEFNISNFSVAPNTFINSAIFQAEIYTFAVNEGLNPGSLGLFGYVGNGIAEVSDFEAGVFLSSIDVSASFVGDILNFDVTPFVNQRINNGDAFTGFGIRALNPGGLVLGGGNWPGSLPRLIVETTDVAEPVPEPTTIFGSALALGVGGWLKQKKSSQQSKTTSQH
jgi:hypothetical protein